MEKKIYWSRIKTENPTNLSLTFEDFLKLLDCYYGNIFVTDGNGITLYFNENEGGWAKLGLSREKHLGKHVSYFVEHGIFSRSVTAEVLKTRQPVSMESADHRGKPFWAHAVPIFDDDDNIIFTVHYSQHQVEISNFQEEIERNRYTIDHLHGILEHYSKNIGNGMELIYRSEKMAQVVQLAKKVAKTDGAVLIGGGSGTGKELLARYIYNESKRSKGVFLAINCAAIPHELIESELFGYLPGAFTGASKGGKPGIFELADTGTIFLDEVGEIPMQVQSKLLRVLESGEISRVGDGTNRSVNVRIIAATNRDLQSMVRENTFREDLYYRLNVIPLVLPSLRERPEDIPSLASFYLKEYNTKYQTSKEFSKACMETFVSYSWPGNVRELKNMIHRMVITTEGDVIAPVSLEANCPAAAPPTQKKAAFSGERLKEALQNYEISYIHQAIDASDGNITRAAEKLGVHRTYIYRKLKHK